MKFLTTIVILSALSLTGCATREYVQTVTDPLAERIGRLETKVTALEAMVARPASLSDADNARLEQANTTARQALDASSRLATELKGAEDNARKAEASANRAEEAALRAENAATSAQQAEKKAEKIFRIQQKK